MSYLNEQLIAYQIGYSNQPTYNVIRRVVTGNRLAEDGNWFDSTATAARVLDFYISTSFDERRQAIEYNHTYREY